MSREEIEKLLGGYATGTLTPGEQQALFEAAVDDQQLFDALGREQPLRDLLRDPAARAHLLAALDSAEAPWYRRWWRPAALAAIAAGAAALGIFVLRQVPRDRPLIVAQVKSPARPEPQAVVEKAAPVSPAPEEKAPVRRAKPAPPPPERAAAVADKASAQATLMLGANVAGARAAPAPAAPAAPTAEQSAMSGSMGGLSAGAGGGGANARTAPRALLSLTQAKPQVQSFAGQAGLRYSVVRELPGGGLAEAEPEQLAAGDTVRLRFVPEESGNLSIVEKGPSDALRQVVSVRLEPGTPFETPPFQTNQAGRREFLVTFSRDAAGTPPGSFTITLNFR